VPVLKSYRREAMIYTYQTWTDSWSFANPEGNDVRHASSIKQLRAALQSWADTVQQYSDEPVRLIVWISDYNDVTDLYPDFELVLGPRGGIVRHPL